jgi:Short-chain dehydrogenases of various substrate specificities
MSRRLGEIHAHAFLTGASTGLGRAFAEMLLAEGVRVWGTARDVARLTELAAKFPAAFTPVALDLGDPEAAERAFARAANSAGGSFDVVVNNAGFGVFSEFAETDFAVWQSQIDRMLVTTLRLAHAGVRGMRRRGRGCLVNVSSLATDFPLPFMSGYNVAKAGLSALSESLIVELHGTGITVVDFRPGDYRTEFNQAMSSLSPVATAPSPRVRRAWLRLEQNLLAAPRPERAADDLRRALGRGRGGVVRSGGFFQAKLAPLFARCAPAAVMRAARARYFGL